MADKKKAAAAAPKAETNRSVSRVKVYYDTEVVPALVKKFGYKSVMQVPKIDKIVINTGLGDIKDNQKSMQITEGELKLRIRRSTAGATIRSGSRSSSSSPRSPTIRSKRSGAWMCASSRRRRPMKRQESF